MLPLALEVQIMCGGCGKKFLVFIEKIKILITFVITAGILNRTNRNFKSRNHMTPYVTQRLSRVLKSLGIKRTRLLLILQGLLARCVNHTLEVLRIEELCLVPTPLEEILL